MWIESLKPIRVQFRLQEVRLEPGRPVELPEDCGRNLLHQAGNKDRIAQPPETVVIEPAAANARPVYWEGSEGKLCGPATPEFLAKTDTGEEERFWVLVTFEGTIRLVWSEILRAKPNDGKPSLLRKVR